MELFRFEEDGPRMLAIFILGLMFCVFVNIIVSCFDPRETKIIAECKTTCNDRVKQCKITNDQVICECQER